MRVKKNNDRKKSLKTTTRCPTRSTILYLPSLSSFPTLRVPYLPTHAIHPSGPVSLTTPTTQSESQSPGTDIYFGKYLPCQHPLVPPEKLDNISPGGELRTLPICSGHPNGPTKNLTHCFLRARLRKHQMAGWPGLVPESGKTDFARRLWLGALSG